MAKITMDISEQCLKDILTIAVQNGGSAYWANEYNGLSEERDDAGNTTELKIGAPASDTDCNEPVKHHKITIASMARALQRLVNKMGQPDGAHRTHVMTLLGECEPEGCGADALACDLVLQMAVFEKIIYG